MIITSLLDTDLYKFTMMQVVLHQFPGAQVEYKFKCRNPGVQLAPFANEIRDEIRSLCCLQFQDAELAYLRSLRFIKSDFVDFLGLFHLNEKYITVSALPSGEIDITIRGPWLHTTRHRCPAGTLHERASHGGISWRDARVALPSDTAVRREEYRASPPFLGGRLSTA